MGSKHKGAANNFRCPQIIEYSNGSYNRYCELVTVVLWIFSTRIRLDYIVGNWLLVVVRLDIRLVAYAFGTVVLGIFYLHAALISIAALGLIYKAYTIFAYTLVKCIAGCLVLGRILGSNVTAAIRIA